MNREEILEMEAGEELDELVADVLGLPKANYNLPNETNYYSMDISAAWRVVRKMMSEEYSYFSNYGDNEKWGVTYAHTIGDLVWADTIEEAICKAALLAKLEKTK